MSSFPQNPLYKREEQKHYLEIPRFVDTQIITLKLSSLFQEHVNRDREAEMAISAERRRKALMAEAGEAQSGLSHIAVDAPGRNEI